VPLARHVERDGSGHRPHDSPGISFSPAPQFPMRRLARSERRSGSLLFAPVRRGQMPSQMHWPGKPAIAARALERATARRAARCPASRCIRRWETFRNLFEKTQLNQGGSLFGFEQGTKHQGEIGRHWAKSLLLGLSSFNNQVLLIPPIGVRFND